MPRIRTVEAIVERVLLVSTEHHSLAPGALADVGAASADNGGGAAGAGDAGSAVSSVPGRSTAPGLAEEAHLVSMLRFSMCQNRFCRNVGRPHRSNNVSFVVNLEAGECRQHCTDDGCRGWRSDAVLLPEEILPDQVPEGVAVSKLGNASSSRAVTVASDT